LHAQACGFQAAELQALPVIRNLSWATLLFSVGLGFLGEIV
jgi:hypothetical protein